jgi:hypothetical protein
LDQRVLEKIPNRHDGVEIRKPFWRLQHWYRVHSNPKDLFNLISVPDSLLPGH